MTNDQKEKALAELDILIKKLEALEQELQSSRVLRKEPKYHWTEHLIGFSLFYWLSK